MYFCITKEKHFLTNITKNTKIMKKIILALFAMVMSISANAFDFDGINLNGNVLEVTRQISAKGYVYDESKDCLKGVCQGTEIYLSVNYADVTQKNKVGQLIVDVPMKESNAIEIISKTFNVVYHLVNKTSDSFTYEVDKDGTTVTVSPIAGGVRLTYNTPYYKVAK